MELLSELTNEQFLVIAVCITIVTVVALVTNCMIRINDKKNDTDQWNNLNNKLYDKKKDSDNTKNNK